MPYLDLQSKEKSFQCSLRKTREIFFVEAPRLITVSGIVRKGASAGASKREVSSFLTQNLPTKILSDASARVGGGSHSSSHSGRVSSNTSYPAKDKKGLQAGAYFQTPPQVSF